MRSELIRHRCNENRRRVRGSETESRGSTESVSGHEEIGRAIERGQLNGDPCLCVFVWGAQAITQPLGHRLGRAQGGVVVVPPVPVPPVPGKTSTQRPVPFDPSALGSQAPKLHSRNTSSLPDMQSMVLSQLQGVVQAVNVTIPTKAIQTRNVSIIRLFIYSLLALLV